MAATGDSANENKQAQDEEVESLQSIYLPEEFLASNRADGTWEILAPVTVTIPEDYKVHYTHEGCPRVLSVQHLPPVTLKIAYRRSYPSKSPPYLTISCVWLKPLERRLLHTHLTRSWSDYAGCPIVYNWIEMVRSEALEITGKTDGLDLLESLTDGALPTDDSIPSGSNAATTHFSRTPRKPRVPLHIIPFLEAYNIQRTRDVFLKSPITCEICFTEKLGKDAIEFSPCRHLFCRECLTGYFTVLVTEGSSASVKCPAYKCESEANQSQVREVLPPDLFEKYDRALLSTMLDTMTDIVYCPRPSCNYPTTWDPEDKVAICPNCRFAFCIYCRLVYHGVEPCKLNADERRKLVENYQEAAPDERARMEARYGKKQIENLVSNTLSEYWIKDNGKKCPKCNIVIEKSDGCNKMTCFRCKAFFCWLCSKILDPKSPYLHYQDPRSGCNNKLFQFVDDIEEDWEMGWEEEEWPEEDEDSDADVDIEGNDTDTGSEVL